MNTLYKIKEDGENSLYIHSLISPTSYDRRHACNTLVFETDDPFLKLSQKDQRLILHNPNFLPALRLMLSENGTSLRAPESFEGITFKWRPQQKKWVWEMSGKTKFYVSSYSYFLNLSLSFNTLKYLQKATEEALITHKTSMERNIETAKTQLAYHMNQITRERARLEALTKKISSGNPLEGRLKDLV